MPTDDDGKTPAPRQTRTVRVTVGAGDGNDYWDMASGFALVADGRLVILDTQDRPIGAYAEGQWRRALYVDACPTKTATEAWPRPARRDG